MASNHMHKSSSTIETTFTNASFELKDEDGLQETQVPIENEIIKENMKEQDDDDNAFVRAIKSLFAVRETDLANELDNDFEKDFDDDENMKNFNSSIGLQVQKVQVIFTRVVKSRILKLALYAVGIIGFLTFSVFAIIAKEDDSGDGASNGTNLGNTSSDMTDNKKFIYFSIVGIISALLLWDNVIVKQDLIFNYFKNLLKGYTKCLTPCLPYSRIIIVSLVLVACLIYLFIHVQDYYNFVSLLGLFVFICIAALMSYHPSKINWINLVSGILIQFLMGLFVLRISFGYNLFKFFGDNFEAFLSFARYGSKLVFGEAYAEHFVVFAAIPTALFFAGVVNVLFHLGIAQYIIIKLTWFLHKLINASPCESMNTIASIFLGQAEAPLLIKPFLANMTVSELFSVMLGGFATVAGSVFAAFIEYGIPANHLLIASIMSAPAALSISKVIYPETKVTKADWKIIKNLKDTSTKNVFEAFAMGACAMISPAASILTNLIVFTAFFEFLNVSIIWLFSLINIDSFGLSDLLKYIFYPIVFLMGIYPEDCSSVAKMVSKKVFVSEFIAFKDLGDVINFRKEIIARGEYELYRNHTFSVPKGLPMIWNERSTVIAAYALCGFSNFAAIGICIGALTALEPSRRDIFARLAGIAMIGGNLACFMTASITGLLYDSKMS